MPIAANLHGRCRAPRTKGMVAVRARATVGSRNLRAGVSSLTVVYAPTFHLPRCSTNGPSYTDLAKDCLNNREQPETPPFASIVGPPPYPLCVRKSGLGRSIITDSCRLHLV